ncbi:MAG: Ni/Fe hydrogenase subunit alpha, partial [Gemmatimonadaceae bacterium]
MVVNARIVLVDVPIRRLRRLIYCGEWIESHALHVFMLHAPDFLGYDSAIAMAGDHRQIVEGGLQIKKAGNALVEMIGGRAVHPVNMRVGGFYRAPAPAELRSLSDGLQAALELTRASARWAAELPFPDFEADYELFALSTPDRYPIEAGTAI